jgi:hypothetical protein
MSVIHIVTPCSRPENLPALYSSIVANLYEADVKWWIVFDAEAVPAEIDNAPFMELHAILGGVAGHKQRNYALDRIQDGYVYQLDDDNIIHSNFPSIFNYCATEKKSAIFGQNLGDGRVRVNDRTNIRQTHIDQGQFLVRREHIADTRYVETDYCADGLFIEQIYHKQPDNFLIFNQVASYYNFLRR